MTNNVYGQLKRSGIAEAVNSNRLAINYVSLYLTANILCLRNINTHTTLMAILEINLG